MMVQTGSTLRPRPVASSSTAGALLIACPVYGQDNDPDKVYCQHCAVQLCGDRWYPHSPHRRFIMPLPLLARLGRHQTPEKGWYCVVCGGTL